MQKMKTVSLETMIDKHIGKIGTEPRNNFEQELKDFDFNIASEPLTKKARKEISEFIRSYKGDTLKKKIKSTNTSKNPK